VLDWYEDKNFILSDGSYNNVIIAPDIYAMVAEDYGFKYRNAQQRLREDILILPSEYFAGGLSEATERTYAIHCGVGMWRDMGVVSASLKRIKKNNLLRKIFRKKLLPHGIN
jgi:hypothetical protein